MAFVLWAALMLTFMAIGIRDWRLARAAVRLARAAHADRVTKAPSDRA